MLDAQSAAENRHQTARGPDRDAQDAIARDFGLDALQSALYEIAVAPLDKHAAIRQFMRVAMRLTNAVGMAYFEDQSGQLVPGPNVDVVDLLADDGHRRQLSRLCEAARHSGNVQVSIAENDGNITLLCVPVMLAGGRCEIMVAYMVFGAEAVEPFVVTLQLIGSYVTLWHMHRNTVELDWEARAIAAIAELLGKMQDGAGVVSGCYVVANELKKFLNCELLAIGLRRDSRLACRIAAVSGMAKFDRQSEQVKAMQAALDETLVRDELTTWPAHDARARQATLAHRKLAEVLGAESIVSSPLKTPQGETIGAWLFVGSQELLSETRFTNLVGASAPQVASALDLVHRAEPSAVGRVFNWFHRHRSGWRMRLVLMSLVAATCILMLPVPYKIRCGCTLEPVMRRFAVAPHDGLLDRSFVETGDLVHQGDVLAVMDGKELRWEIAGLVADRSRAAKKRDVSQAAGDIPEAQLAQLEVERIDVKLQLLERREQQLEIKSPLDGVILASNVDNVERLPVKPGSIVCEIAPLDQIRLTVAVPADEMLHVRPSSEVELRLDACPGEVITGTVTAVRPRSEIRDGENVFVADVVLDNDEQRLRPGMDGHAKVISAARPLAWVLFHKAVNKAESYFDW
jgi:hypothetical protein